jgi:hypothetical protein
MPEADPEFPEPTPPELDFETFQRIYGRVEALLPAEAAVLFDGAGFSWWVAGGWSTELGPAVRRVHEDLEVAVARRDLDSIREWLSDFHVWDTFDHGLRFLAHGDVFPPDHEQLWLRRDASSPWLMDLMVTPVEGETWFYKRDRRVSRPLTSVIRWGADGVPYQRPEITLLFKARRRSLKDEEDFAAVVASLGRDDRSWLRDAIELTEPPSHPWLERLD